VSLTLDAGHSDTYKYPRTVPLRGEINGAIAISCENPVYVTSHPRWIPLLQRASSNIWRPPFVLRKNHPRWHPRKLARRLTRLRRQHCWPQKRERPSPSLTPPTKRLLKTTLSTPAALKDNRKPPRLRPTGGRRPHRGRRSPRRLSGRTATAARPAHQEPQSPEAKRDTGGQAPACVCTSQGAANDTR
jgi:hypothetical protein